MVKNLRVYNNQEIKKLTIHNLIILLKKELNFKIKFLEISFVNSEEINRINKKFLNHNYSTDIITFDYSKSQSFLEGEIIISLDDALQNAKKFGISLSEEIIRLLIHGILHMLGFDDIKPAQKKVMRRTEVLLFKKFKFLA